MAQPNCHCGAQLSYPIQGMVQQGPNGERLQIWVCSMGHQVGVAKTATRRCPNCHHTWTEAAQDGSSITPAPRYVTPDQLGGAIDYRRS